MFFRNKDKKIGFWVLGAAFSIVVAIIIVLSCTGCAKGSSQNLDYEVFYNSRKSMTTEQLLKEAGKLFFKYPDSALFYYKMMEAKYSPALPEKEQYLYAEAYNSMGTLYFYMWSDYQQAMIYYLKLQELCQKYDFKDFLPDVNFNIGTVYTVIGDLDYARDFYKKAFYQAKEQQQWFIVQFSLANLGSDALNQGDLTSIIPEMEVFGTLEIPETSLETKYYRSFYEVLDAIVNRNFDRAYACFDSMEVAAAGATADKERVVAFILDCKSATYAMQGEYDSAIAVCLRAEQIMQGKEGLDDMQSGNYEKLSEYYDIIGYKNASLECMAKSFEIKNRQLNSQKVTQIHRIKNTYEIDRITDQIRDEQRKRHMQGVILIITLIALTITAILLIRLFSQKRDLEQKNRKLYQKMQAELEQSAPAVKYAGNNLDEERKENLLNQILAIMEQGGEIFSEDFSIGRLAKMADSSERYISQVINELYHKNFNDLLAEYRIREACRRIKDTENYGNLTIEGIANGLGFKSRGNFYAVFKKVVGMTPAQYRRIGKEIRADS